MGPKYSELWFDSKGRTTATMIIFLGTCLFPCKGTPTTDLSSFIANPIGGALGQVLSPVFSDTRKSVRVHLTSYRDENVDVTRNLNF